MQKALANSKCLFAMILKFDDCRELSSLLHDRLRIVFLRREVLRFHDLPKTAKQAVCEVLGSEIYDEIDEMHRGEVKDRRVKIHHSLGTKHQKQGEDVLELEFAGSGGKDTLKKHKDHDGDIVESRFASQEEAEAFYGKKALKPNGKDYFDYIRYKEKTMTLPDGSTSAKTRYSFAGPTPDLKYWPGIPNVGEYSVENTRENARYYAAQFIAPRFEKWLKGEKEPKRIRIDLSGHSRGAVTAGQTAKLIDAWITEYIKNIRRQRISKTGSPTISGCGIRSRA